MAKRMIVAAFNSPGFLNFWGTDFPVHYICDGLEDEVQLQHAAEMAHPHSPILLPGKYTLSESVTLVARSPSRTTVLSAGTYKLEKPVG